MPAAGLPNVRWLPHCRALPIPARPRPCLLTWSMPPVEAVMAPVPADWVLVSPFFTSSLDGLPSPSTVLEATMPTSVACCATAFCALLFWFCRERAGPRSGRWRVGLSTSGK